MKLRCETKALADSLTLVGSVVPARSPKPVLANVKLVARDGNLELMATDLEVGVRRTLTDVEVDEAGEILLPAAQASNIVREATAKQIEISTEDGTCVIAYTGARYDIPGDEPADFPEMPVFNDKNAVTVDAAQLKQMIERTKFAVAREQARYALNGILFSLKGNVLRLVATDGRRLALSKGEAKNKPKLDAEPIIPTKAMDLLDRLMTGGDEKVRVEIGESQVIAETPAGTVCTRLVEGHFPDYEEVVPRDCDKTLEIDGGKLLSAIRRAALITNEESRSVQLQLKPDSLLLTTHTLEGRRASVEADGASFEGEPMKIAFNPDFFTEMLRVIGDERVKVSLKDSASAALVEVGKTYMYIVMPVQVRED
jgi:DNA polymerase-3 subunit beta